MEGYVTTFTIMTVHHDGHGGSIAITSKVNESAGSALEHLTAMSKGRPEPVYDVTSGGWRWTWEYVGLNGARCTDTVRVY